MKPRKMLCLITTVALVAPVQLSAQPCLGIPAADGQFAFQAGVGLTSGATSYGGSFTANFHGPLSAGAGYTYTDFDRQEMPEQDPSGNTVNANVAYEIPGIGFSGCPILGFEYSHVTGVYWSTYGWHATVRSLAFPVGIGVGKTLPVARNMRLTPFGSGQLFYWRSEYQVEGPVGDNYKKRIYDGTELGAVLGFLFGSETVQIGGSGSVTTIDGSDPNFKLGLSLVF